MQSTLQRVKMGFLYDLKISDEIEYNEPNEAQGRLFAVASIDVLGPVS